ncbi:unnamed protein product, partial [Symbiodinium necroappetens]
AMLKMPGKSSNMEEDLASILWGSGPPSSSSRAPQPADSDDEAASVNNGAARPRRGSGSGGANKRRKSKSKVVPDASFPSGLSSQPPLSDAASNAGGPGGDLMQWVQNPAKATSKKKTAENKELEKSESVILAAQQLQASLESAETVMTVALNKTNQLLEKIHNRLSEEEMKALYSEAVMSQGPNSRAANVWKSLQEKLALVEHAANFIEAFHDDEAAASTLAARAQALRDVGVSLPQQVNCVLARKELAAFASDDNFHTFMQYLDPAMKDKFPTGVGSLMDDSMKPTEPDTMAPILDFQVGAVVQTLNNLLLSVKATGANSSEEVSSSSDAGAGISSVPDAKAAVNRLVKFLAEFKKSPIANVCDSNANLKIDLERFESLVQLTMSDDALDEDSCEILQTARTNLLKNKQGPFNKGLTLFPIGIFLSDLAQKRIHQFKADMLFQIDVGLAVQIAGELKVMNVDSLLKDKQGEMELAIPSQAKIVDMVAKWQAAVDGASIPFKTKHKAELEIVESKIQELKTGFLSVVAYKTNQFQRMEALIAKLGEGGFKDAEALECGRLLSGLEALQPLHKVPLIKLLGKDGAQQLEDIVAPAFAFFKQFAAAFSQVVKISQVSVMEGEIMAKEIIDLYASLHDNGLINKVKTVAPWIHVGLNNLTSFLEKAAKDWVTASCGDFAKFAAQVLDPEANFEDIVRDLPAAAPADGSDVDFSFIYMSFAAVLKGKDALVQMPRPADESKDQAIVRVHCSFLCLCGVLGQMTRHAKIFQNLLTRAEACKAFSGMLLDYKKALQEKNAQFVFETKAGVLATAVGGFEKLQAALAQYQAISNTLTKDDNMEHGTILNYYKKLLAHIKASFQQMLSVGRADLEEMMSSGKDMFSNVRSRFEVRALFQADPLNKQSIQSLFKDEKVQLLAIFAPKAKDFLTSTGIWVKGIRSFPLATEGNEAAMTQECHQLATAVQQDAQFFQRVDANDENPSLVNLTEFQMNVTMAQALTRDLLAGETRVGLVNRCYNLVKVGELPLDKSLRQRALTMIKGK